MAFLQKIWQLRAMDSEDSRFKNAYDDIYQHIINNNDWDDDYLYLTRLKLIDDSDAIFTKFIETVVHPETRSSKEEIFEYVQLINGLLVGENIRLTLADYFEELPVYQLKNRLTTSDLPIEIAHNRIPFFTTEPNEYPCFVFTQTSWDDFGSRTLLTLRYYADESSYGVQIGNVKITSTENNRTWDTLAQKFIVLDQSYCSLGQSRSYYMRLKERFPNSFQSILLALRDAAIFPRIADIFENTSTFRNSLIRENEAEQLLRTIRFELQNDDLNQYFKFNYSFKPPFSEHAVNFYFDFDYGGEVEKRVIALIGKNGTGKTSLLSTLIQTFARQNSNQNLDKMPLFGKYFTVSYSVFDRFVQPAANDAFNYVYCGLKRADGNLRGEPEMLEEFFESAEKIMERDLSYQWYKILKNFLSEAHLSLIFPNGSNELEYGMVKFNPANFNQIKTHFSSGESISIFIITKIVSEIRLNSLILYDEPETHLHPNAITSLMSSLFDLVSMFKSFCIIATHSPLIVRELHSNQVKVLKREVDSLEIYNLERDSFGENLSVITDEIFGNRDVNKYYRTFIRSLVEKGKSFDQIVQLIQDGEMPLSLNTRLFLNTLIPESDDEPETIS